MIKRAVMTVTMYQHPTLPELWCSKDGRVFRVYDQTPDRGYAVVACRGSWLRHILLLETFRGRRPYGHVGRHLNDDPRDLRIENLAWGTHAENIGDAVRNGKRTDAIIV